MKRKSFAIAAASLLALASCKEIKKGDEEGKAAQEENTAVATYSIVEDATKIHFTAYKTTDKVPVGGDFTKVDLTYEQGATAKDVLDGLAFSIPVSSLFTNDATGTRDPKILEFFFGVMADTELIKGKFSVKDDAQCVATLSMNGVTADLPMAYSIAGDTVTLEGTMELKEWNALEALASLNKACEILHTGPTDGISKTWEDVKINAAIQLAKN